MRFRSPAGATLLAAVVALAALAPAAAAGPQERKLRTALSKAMRSAGGGSGAYVWNLAEAGRLFRKRGSERRILASNTKLFTTAAVLDRFGSSARLRTSVHGEGLLDPAGTWRGDLYLVGGGDPTFGSASFARANGGRASAQLLATRIEQAGVTRVSGRVWGDESRYDSRRGGPASGFATSIYVGPLSALSFNRGFGSSGFQRDPPTFAARRLTKALERRGVPVAGAPRAGVRPSGTTAIASVLSPDMAELAARTNKPSDNFFAELLLKELSAGQLQGTTARGSRRAERFAASLGSTAQLVDGSGLSRRNRAAPREVVDLLRGLASRRAFVEFPAFRASLAVAGRDGTLASRMRGRAAAGRCRAKTGTLYDVSALSGYCDSRGGDRVAFSFLMNGVDVSRARDLQDRMANALARYRG